MIITWIQSLPLWLGFIIVVGSGVLLSSAGTLIVNMIFTPEELIQNNVVGGFKFAFLAQIVASLLAFSLVDSASRFSSFQQRCDRELAAISLLEKLEVALPSSTTRLRSARRDYLRSVVDKEWSAMKVGQQSPEAEANLGKWFMLAISIEPRREREKLELSQYVRTFSQVVENRLGRLNDASSSFEGLVWTSLSIAILITITFNWFFGSNSLSTQVAMGTLLAGGVMSLVFLVITLSSPLVGDLAVQPDIYIKMAL
jgi:hypothetical protein